ncbi:hypothetical protein DENSPDRAFT_856388 [Dentipellis sp. KUC8613]|nr:hypothetical protein DENSPDRAFT_856388 [Dentipellis sp. KUC8613]
MVLDAFRLKEYDLEPVLTSWKDAPRFTGNPKKDLPVDDWLDQIKAGCVERKVPKEYWHKVGQHYLGKDARARFDELKAVLKNMHGGRYNWDWKKFKVAMRNMGWNIDPHKTESFEVQSKPSGLWWIIGKNKPEQAPSKDPDEAESKSKSAEKASGKESRSGRSPEKKASTSTAAASEKGDKAERADEGRKTSWLSRAPSTASFRSSVTRRSSTDSVTSELSSAMSTTMAKAVTPSPPSSVASTPAQSPGEVTTTVTHAPVWLLNACNALDFLSTEHPKAMTAVSAILITVGSLPALPGITAGAGGAILASHAVQAAGAIAVGVGNWLKAAQDAAAAKAALAEGQQGTAPQVDNASSAR